MDLGPFSKAGQVKGSVRPNGKGRLMAGEGDAEQEPEQAAFAGSLFFKPPYPIFLTYPIFFNPQNLFF